MTEFDAANSSEVPEADRLEQSLDVSDPAAAQPEVSTPLEANEADAAEQNIAVPDDEDYPRS
ncbi:hypothetical protein [Rhodococcus sp. NPDC058521]|uniref:hypothetical protein n=1 Tax=Rhodococcus sp. NPDC058521 TaxID=3346536 RepID=UPI003653ADF7